MKSREKILMAVVGGLAGVALLGLLVKVAVVDTVKKMDTTIASTRGALAKLREEQRAFQAADDKLKAFAKTTFADSVEQASAKSGEMLTKVILQSGLHELEFSRTPFGPHKLRGAEEVGWSIQGEGMLRDVVDLMFLLQESPYLHRIENINITPGEVLGEVRVSLRYLTLALEPMPAVSLADLEPKFTLYSPERKTYEELEARDILRPYVKRPPPPPPGTRPTTTAAIAAAAAAPPPGPETFKVVSLSEWAGQPEIHILDLTAMKTTRHKAGDLLAGGQVVLVDFRPLPKRGNEALQSYSRVIIKIATEYWAIERGQTLADKYRLRVDQLPESLSKL